MDVYVCVGDDGGKMYCSKNSASIAFKQLDSHEKMRIGQYFCPFDFLYFGMD